MTIFCVPLPNSSLGGTFTSISVQVVEIQAQKNQGSMLPVGILQKQEHIFKFFSPLSIIRNLV